MRGFIKPSQILIIARLAGFEPADDGNDKVKLYIISYVKYRLKY